LVCRVVWLILLARQAVQQNLEEDSTFFGESAYEEDTLYLLVVAADVDLLKLRSSSKFLSLLSLKFG
jgi:hypothetical protein